MATFQCEPAIKVSGRELTVVTRVTATWLRRGGAFMFAGDKRPVAVIYRGKDGEEIFSAEGGRMDAAALQTLMVRQNT